MAFKDILVHVDSTVQGRQRFDLALDLACRHQSHLIALNVRSRSLLSSRMTAQFGPDMDAVLAQGDAEAAAATRDMVDARRHEAEFGLEWRDVPGDPLDLLAVHGRYCDLVVVGQGAADDPLERDLADHLMLTLGRPLLVVPGSGRFEPVGGRVLVAWNASREATRAVHDALPILEAADHVRVIAVNPDHGLAGHGDIPGADIALHLSRHGVRAECEHIRSDEILAASMLLNRAAEEAFTLVVMGGYGHSRLREMVLGGVTRHMLNHMTIPVFFSH